MSQTTGELEKHGFEGLAVAAFESRMAKEMEDLITRHGGHPHVAPSMREIPLTENKPAFQFFDHLQQGEVDVIVFMTGVGTKILFDALETHIAPSRIQKAFKHAVLVPRGPKAVKALSDRKLRPSIAVAEPNTWKEILEALDREHPIKGLTVAVQEYGISNEEFINGLKSRGAKAVYSVPVYKWALPEDARPLVHLVETIAGGEVSVALFTSATQVQNVFQVAKGIGLEDRLKEAFSRMVVASVGSVCTEALKEHGVAVDLEPEHPKMGFLVKETSEKGPELLKKKTVQPVRVSRASAPTIPANVQNSLFLKACRKEPTVRTPLWIMRQAGRYLPEYRNVRSKVSFLELCKTPELAAEVTISAQETLDVDAAILFADILLISEPLGFQLSFAESGGPVIHNPFRSAEDLKRLVEVDGEFDLGYVMQAVRLIRAGLKSHIPLIGFAGAPFTLASYLIEGGGSKDYYHTRTVMSDIKLWDELMKRLVSSTVSYLNGQVNAGAQAIQLFDSWVGILAPEEFQRLVLPYLRLLTLNLRKLQPNIPVIYFGTQTSPFFPYLRETGATVMGVDWRSPLDQAWKQLGDVAIQGNLSPEILLTDPAKVRIETEKVLRQANGKPGHIFNLGHGILPQTPMDNVRAMIDTVKNWKP